jgi:hypothetical protein
MFQNRVRDGLPSQLVRRSVHKKGPVSRVSPLTYAARNANATLPAMNASALPDDRRRGRRLLPRLRRARVGVPPVYHRRCRNATGCQRLRAPKLRWRRSSARAPPPRRARRLSIDARPLRALPRPTASVARPLGRWVLSRAVRSRRLNGRRRAVFLGRADRAARLPGCRHYWRVARPRRRDPHCARRGGHRPGVPVDAISSVIQCTSHRRRMMHWPMVRRAECDHPPRMIRPGWDRRSGPWCGWPKRREGPWPTASR